MFSIWLPALLANKIYFEETLVSYIILPEEPFLTCSILAKKDKKESLLGRWSSTSFWSLDKYFLYMYKRWCSIRKTNQQQQQKTKQNKTKN